MAFLTKDVCTYEGFDSGFIDKKAYIWTSKVELSSNLKGYAKINNI